MLCLAGLLAYPLLVPDFWVVSVGAQAIILGVITLSLTFLAAYGGMVSLAQMATAGVAAYTLAVLSSHSANAGAALLPWPAALAVGVLAGILAGLLIGAVAVRSRGIYLLMSTLAIAMIFYYLAQQNTTILHGFDETSAGVAVPGPSAAYRYASRLISITSALLSASLPICLSSTWCEHPSGLHYKVRGTTRCVCVR